MLKAQIYKIGCLEFVFSYINFTLYLRLTNNFVNSRFQCISKFSSEWCRLPFFTIFIWIQRWWWRPKSLSSYRKSKGQKHCQFAHAKKWRRQTQSWIMARYANIDKFYIIVKVSRSKFIVLSNRSKFTTFCLVNFEFGL